MNERKTFLDALNKNEDDITTRLVYADWLDEQGEHDEADRMRKWPAAKAWLVKFCEENNPRPEYETDEWVIDYATLLDLGREAVGRKDADQGLWFSCGNNMEMMNSLYANRAEFWENWSIVTGIPVPPDAGERSGFSCAC